MVTCDRCAKLIGEQHGGVSVDTVRLSVQRGGRVESQEICQSCAEEMKLVLPPPWKTDNT